MTSSQTVTARAVRRFPLEPARVFAAWLDPAKIRDWFGPGLGPMVRIDVDPRVGGTFCWVQRRGDTEVEHIGEYVELDRPRRIVFTFATPPDPASRVVVDIVPLGGGSGSRGGVGSGGAGRGAGGASRDAGSAGVSAGAGCEVSVTHEIPSEWAAFVPRSIEAWSKMLDAMAKVA